jgi:hypothetical protein
MIGTRKKGRRELHLRKSFQSQRISKKGALEELLSHGLAVGDVNAERIRQ